MLVIGCGAGVTAGAVSIDPLRQGPDDRRDRAARAAASSRRTSPSTTSTSSRIPKVTIHIDDARHYLLTTNEKFDAITSDPLDPWVKGAATLYTREFFEVVKEHLNPGRRRDAVRAAVREQRRGGEERDRDVPRGVPERRGVRATRYNGQGYDLVLFGQVEAGKINVDEMQATARRSRRTPPIAQSLREIGINSAIDLFATYAGQRSDMKPWLSDAQINTRSQPAAAVSRRPRPEPLSERRDLQGMIREVKYPERTVRRSPTRRSRRCAPR